MLGRVHHTSVKYDISLTQSDSKIWLVILTVCRSRSFQTLKPTPVHDGVSLIMLRSPFRLWNIWNLVLVVADIISKIRYVNNKYIDVRSLIAQSSNGTTGRKPP